MEDMEMLDTNLHDMGKTGRVGQQSLGFGQWSNHGVIRISAGQRKED